jgi:heat shock protein HslJ
VSQRLLIAGLVLLFLCPVLGACSREGEAPSAAASGPGGMEQSSVPSALEGRTWQLVEIVSTDDRIDAPDDRSLYTVVFNADGSVQIRADCNRGTGAWTTSAPGKLQFGEIAATRAPCLPGSLHDRYMAQFPRVRSYVMKDGHLFLATKADGPVIEFQPVELTLAATVLGEEVRTDDSGEMQEIVLTRLFDRYAEEQGIEVTDAEIGAYVDAMERGMRAEGLGAEDELTPDEAAEVEQMRRDMGRAMIRQWKLNRALYRQYGGRIIYQQLGPEPIDAYRRYLEERRAAGDFTIHQKAFEDRFWRYFTTDSMHDFYASGSEEETRALVAPPWQEADPGAGSSAQPAPEDGVPAAPEDGGPINWEINGATGGLHLRARPSTSAEILATYPSGTILDNLGCRPAGDRVWCDVQKFGGGPRGYVAADYLQPAAAPDGSMPRGPETTALRAGRGEFEATGKIPCAQHAAQPLVRCDFGVARQGGGFATVVVTKPDGMKRAIDFHRGIPIGADTSGADGYGEFSYGKDGDLNLIRVGDERYEIPDAVVAGG